MSARDLSPAVAKVIRKGKRFVITTHINPDGDGLGSALGLARFLRQQGKQARILYSGGVPKAYAWLSKGSEWFAYDPAAHDKWIARADAIFVLDLADWKRLNALEAPVRASEAVKITIDHHPVQENGSDLYWNDLGAAAVGEMIYRLIRRMKGTVTKAIADPLYVSIVTDTGYFRFTNTDRDTHEIAAHLVAAGADSYEVYRRIYESSSARRLKLLGRILAEMQVDPGQKLAWVVLPNALIQEYGIRDEETEGYIDVIRTLEGVEVSALFKEPTPGRVRVNLRSARTVDVSRVAAHLGGGGHARAAGLTVEQPIGQVVERVIGLCRQALAAPQAKAGSHGKRAR